MSCLVVQTSCNYFLFKGNFTETTTFEDSDRRARVIRTSGGLGSEEESETVETHDRQQPPLGKMTMIH